MTTRGADEWQGARTLQRLPGKARGLLAQHLALIGDDHLVLVRRIGYRDIYRRVELADIQAIALQPVRDSRVGVAILGAAALVPALFAALSGGGWRWFWGLIAAALLGLLGVHLLRGPGCRVHLRTPVDWIQMPSLRRLRVAELALLTIEDRIGRIQGHLTTDAARERFAEVAPALAVPRPAPFGALGAAIPAPLPGRAVTRRWHDLLVALLLGQLAVSAAQGWAESRSLDLFALIFFLVEVGVAITAVVVQARSDLPRGLRSWAVAALVGISASFVLSAYVVTFAAAFSGETPPGLVGQPLSVSGMPRVVLAIVQVAVVGGLLVARLALPRAQPRAAP